MARRRIATGVLAVALSSCGTDPSVPLEPVTLKVISFTTGLPVPDGYTLSINGSLVHHLDTSDSLVITDLDAGQYTLELQGLTPDCRVKGENPRTLLLIAGTRVQSAFHVECIPPNSGTVLVRTATYGDGPTHYQIILEGGLFVETIANDELLTLFPVPIGLRAVQILGVPESCQLNGANPRFVLLSEPGNIAGTVFKVNCLI